MRERLDGEKSAHVWLSPAGNRVHGNRLGPAVSAQIQITDRTRWNTRAAKKQNGSERWPATCCSGEMARGILAHEIRNPWKAWNSGTNVWQADSVGEEGKYCVEHPAGAGDSAPFPRRPPLRPLPPPTLLRQQFLRSMVHGRGPPPPGGVRE